MSTTSGSVIVATSVTAAPAAVAQLQTALAAPATVFASLPPAVIGNVVSTSNVGVAIASTLYDYAPGRKGRNHKCCSNGHISQN